MTTTQQQDETESQRVMDTKTRVEERDATRRVPHTITRWSVPAARDGSRSSLFAIGLSFQRDWDVQVFGP